jgi:hypothetical protein
MANPEHLAILKQGVEVWNRWRDQNVTLTPDLREMLLYRRSLVNANLSRCLLQGARLGQAILRGADLTEANVRIDDSVMKTDMAWAASIRRTRQIGDFSNWKDHDSYQQAFQRLLRDLRAEGTASA